jgi:hypothetical protein
VGTKDGKIIQRIYKRKKKSLCKFEVAHASNPFTRRGLYG